MGEIFRIVDRFQVTGRGTVYMIMLPEGVNIHLGDLLFDLKGNRFEVSGIEMIRRCTDYKLPVKEEPIGIMVKSINGVEAEGNILVRDVYRVNFLFCNHPLYQYKVDEDYKKEYEAAGLLHACALFSYEDMENGKLSLYGEKIQGLTIYRGWMMKPEMYREFYHALERKGIILINSPEEYERYHLLPGWYLDFKEWTIESVWENEGNIDSMIKISKKLEGAYIVKDFVKSRKHEWYDACFIENISNEVNARRVIGNFIKRQGESLVGGVVLRKYVDLNHIGFHERSGMPISEEYRVFVYAGKVLIIDHYWKRGQKPILSEEEYQWINEICKKIRSNFVSLDLARTTDGRLIIMELGDGQVSGLQEIEEKCFYDSFPSGLSGE